MEVVEATCSAATRGIRMMGNVTATELQKYVAKRATSRQDRDIKLGLFRVVLWAGCGTF